MTVSVTRQPHRPRRSPHVFAVAAMSTAFALVLAACGAGGVPTSPSAAASAAPSAAASEPAASASALASEPASAAPSEGAAQDLAVDGKEFAYELPASIAAGPTKVTLNNVGQEEHQAQVARLNSGVDMAALTTALQNPDPSGALALLTLVGGPTGVLPGAKGASTVDLQPGLHVFLCFVESADGVPHLAKGMIAPLEVTEPASTATVPTGDASVALQDFSFVGLDTLTPGAHTVTVTNNGPQPHEATLVKLADGVTVPDLLAQVSSGEPSTGPLPWTSAGGIAGIMPGTTASFDVDLPAGEYAFICFVPDPATGKPHFQLGMIGALSVK